MKALPCFALLSACLLAACSPAEEPKVEPATTVAPASEPAAKPVAPKPKPAPFVPTAPTAQIDIGSKPASAWSDLSIGVLQKEEGVVVELFEIGEGVVVKKYTRVKASYQGWVKGESEVFDSSLGAEPISFPVGIGAVIDGWDESILGMTIGTRARMHIPASMGYGDKGNPPIPGGADLVFDIVLVEAVKK